MKICDLKIEQDFWDLIKKRIKRYEVRRGNKNHINIGDIIRYRDIEGQHTFGYAKVKNRYIESYDSIVNNFSDLEYDGKTVVFVRDHYEDAGWVLVLEIKPMEWWQ